nr:helix-turn-helix transcriptional regulator [uncultured Allomuricauda sp.]
MNKGVVSRIETIITHLELSVSAFADEIGVQRSSISHLLSGRNKPSLDFVMKLVDTYPQVDLYWLLKGEGNFPKMPEDNQNKIAESELNDEEKNITSVKHGYPIQKKSDSKEPYKIVLFYEDGTFKTFNTKKD